MARPTKWRKIDTTPAMPYFSPSEEEQEGVDCNMLLLEELEALRLKDLEGLEQAECAERMEVSRPTFQRILNSAHEKVADALVNGRSIHIAGGNYTRNICNVVCDDCNSRWKESFEQIQLIRDGVYSCPTCGSKHVHCAKNCKGQYCHKHCCKNR